MNRSSYSTAGTSSEADNDGPRKPIFELVNNITFRINIMSDVSKQQSPESRPTFTFIVRE